MDPVRENKHVVKVDESGITSAEPRSSFWVRVRLAISGAALAVLAWKTYAELFPNVIPYIGNALTMLAAAVIGGWAGIGRARRLIWYFAVSAFGLVLIIAFSPWM